jgi:hypothetical protein
MSYLRDLLKEIGVPRVEKKLRGLEEVARTWGQPVKSRYIMSPFAERVPLEPADPDEAFREECRKRMADIFDITPQEDARRRR